MIADCMPDAPGSHCCRSHSAHGQSIARCVPMRNLTLASTLLQIESLLLAAAPGVVNPFNYPAC